MNRINPTKLRNSKWTAVAPKNREKHFLASDIEFNEEGVVVSCDLEVTFRRANTLSIGLNLKTTRNGYRVGSDSYEKVLNVKTGC